MADVVEQFRALQLEDRKNLLNELADSLDPYEWRNLRDKLQERSFHVDLIGSPDMPFELVLHIFSYLDINDIYRNQRVSKTWQRLLSSPKIIDQFIRPWYGASDPPLICEQDPAENRDEAYVRHQKIEHIRRLRTCQPTARAAFPFSPVAPLTPFDRTPHCNFSGEIFAWVDDNEDGKLNVMNVRTGMSSSATMPGREQVYNLVLTTAYMVCMPHGGYAYAFKIDDINDKCGLMAVRAQIRLPSIPRTIWGEESIVAFLFPESGNSAVYEVIIWNMSEERSHSFRGNAHHARSTDDKAIPAGWPVSPECMILHESSQRVTIISITLDNSFVYQTFSLKGELLNQRFVRELTTLPEPSEFVPDSSRGFLSPEINGLVVDYSSYRVLIPVNQQIGVNGSLRPLDLFPIPREAHLFLHFDFLQQTLGITTLPPPAKPLQNRPDSCRLLTWNSIVYDFERCLFQDLDTDYFDTEFMFPCIIYDRTTDQDSVTRSGLVSSFPIAEGCRQVSWGEQETVRGERCDLDVLGNDRYLVMVIPTAFFVFYFDPDIKITLDHFRIRTNSVEED